ncbi:flagellar basal body-associated FliL family protein [Magnetofaba australis]|uniref:Flagellar protein FliL n=1 Tax=Magnetofaba australis IT-1 TaxID=1434232 RepID=A0A1Y2K0U6_9PROT|nr:flagellar basal body-associated FliL family protein [Magnetofaba australis]OSM00373.1 putative flagellar basal body-associated protein FliL [Magnetofaba australis IT-1]
MAEEAEQEEGGGGGLIKMLIVAIPALLVGAGAGYFLGGMSASSDQQAEQTVDPEGEKTPRDPKETLGETFKLEPFVVNLAETRGNRYLKATIELELDTEELRPELERRIPQLRDVCLSLLGSKTSTELLQAEGKYKLSEEIRARVNALLANGNVKQVFFTEFVIQ